MGPPLLADCRILNYGNFVEGGTRSVASARIALQIPNQFASRVVLQNHHTLPTTACSSTTVAEPKEFKVSTESEGRKGERLLVR